MARCYRWGRWRGKRTIKSCAYEFQGKRPRVAADVFLAPGARLIGGVTVAGGASIWYNAVLRGDVADILVGARSNVQDNTVVHGDHDLPALIGDEVTVGHTVILHGCRLGRRSFIGMGAIVMSGCEIGAESVVAAGSLLPEGMVVPSGVLVMGRPAKVVRDLTPADRERFSHAFETYYQRARAYLLEGYPETERG